ncbi:hypothetical protein JFL43_09425 [Viridibacillus sp. YIM B01967]|uniref:Uncharacterized protein n=1 Tax=Viridibacillus soli TaxID=2798301 RepID=A0ABS1H6Q7_9BACL|nr:hypothetical protein [Viridibacillus soli]MBK3495075.1 hypothetical protein [Viridibacillus soli]
MFEDDLKNMSVEEREEALGYMEELLESVSIGNGDYWIGNNGEIVIDN